MALIIRYLFYFWNAFIFRVNGVFYAEMPVVFGRLWIRAKSGQVNFGNAVVINSNKWINPVGLTSRTYICATNGAIIDIGNGVGISNSLLYARQSIIIEDNVKIGGGCQILDNDFHSIDHSIRNSDQDQDNVIAKGIVIKNGAFIGTGSIILKGVVIGENSIVAAGSVVSKCIPSGEIWGGNPAKFIKYLNKD